MEEILASIRRIISDDKEPPPGPEPEVLELTQALQDDGTVVDLAQPEPAAPPPRPEPAPIVEPEPVAVAETPPLVSEHAATEAASALSSLASTVEIEELATAPRSSTIMGNGARTLEDMTIELMRPLLRQWLDEHLPPIVDRLVQKEIERISRRAKD
jgi:cell pole-organizing protein PopZ